jgi:hypothetical protein
MPNYRLPINGQPLRYRSPIGGQAQSGVAAAVEVEAETAYLSFFANDVSGELQAAAETAYINLTANDVLGPVVIEAETAYLSLTANDVAGPVIVEAETAYLSLTANDVEGEALGIPRAGMQVWLQADSITGLTDGQAVSTWSDSSGNGRNATQPTAANRPVYKTNIKNGKPVVRFTGTNSQFLTFGQLAALQFDPASQRFTIFVVYFVALGNTGSFLTWRMTGNGGYQTFTTINAQGIHLRGTTANSPVISTQAWNIGVWVGESNTTGDLYRNSALEVDNAVVGTETPLSTIDVLLGARRSTNNTDTTFPLTGDIAEVIAYNRVLTTDESKKVTQYLKEKYALYYFFTNFSEYPSSTATGWIQRWNSASVSIASGISGQIGGKSLNLSSTTSNRKLYSWDPAGQIQDVEVLARVRTTDTGGDRSAVFVRGSGAAGSEIAYGAYLSLGTEFRVNRYLNGANAILAQPGFTFSINTWYWIRFRVIGNQIKAKVWPDSGSEPVAWTVEVADSNIAGAGYVGVGGFTGTGTNNYDVFSVATDGNTAPTS